MGDVFVIKMTQRFSKNSMLPANEQISKMVIDMLKQKLVVYYHMNEGEITPKIINYSRESMLGFAKVSETSADKKVGDTSDQQDHQKMLAMEKDCLKDIIKQETAAQEEEKLIRTNKVTIEKTLHDKARDKFKETLKKTEEEVNREAAANDYLYPFLEKKNLLNKTLTVDDAKVIKAEVMSKLKERLLSRADIIQKRLEEERRNLEAVEQQIQKKNEIDKNQQQLQNDLNFKIDILEQRALRFEFIALQKYEEMNRKLSEDSRLQVLNNM